MLPACFQRAKQGGLLHPSLNYHTSPNHRQKNSTAKSKLCYQASILDKPRGLKPLFSGQIYPEREGVHSLHQLIVVQLYERRCKNEFLCFRVTGKHQCWTPETRFVLIYSLTCGTSATPVVRAKVAAVLFGRCYHLSRERLNNNKIAPDLPISCEMGSSFHTDLVFLHAMNHLQEEHQGKSV